MPKKFYTDHDIEELYHSGIKSLQVNDDVVLTDLAYEKARRLGFQLISDRADAPPAAPVRPYLSDMSPRPASTLPAVVNAKPKVDPVPQSSASAQADVAGRIRSAVLARLGNQVDAKLLDGIIQRVIKATGVK